MRFSKQANEHHRFTNAEDLLNDTEAIAELIEHHKNNQRPRLKTLREYYKGNNAGILVDKRRREEHLADNRATHNFAKYVSQFIQGYMMGVPLKTTYPNESVDEQIRDINRDNDADEHNSELVLDQSIYGRAYEMLYRGSDDKTRFTALSPLDTFVIYDDTVEFKPIAAIRYIGRQYKEELDVYLYTDKVIKEYELGEDGELETKEELNHFFGGVPVIEYENNKYRQGDFEDVMTLLDLYDAAQSDTANYIQDLNDAMLVIMGNLDIDEEKAKHMKDHNLLFLQTEPNADGKEGSADAKYIYKQYDVQGAEAYKDRIFNNILLFTSIPNLLDDKQGAGPQSGEALKMKLFALSQKRATKERLFKRSLRDRYRLINNMMSMAAEGSFDVNEILITFTENLPSMIGRDLEWFIKAGGRLSQKTLIANLPFVENADEELEQIEEEDLQSQAGKSMYDFEEDGSDESIEA